MSHFNLHIKQLSARVIDLSVECHIEMYAVEKVFEHIMRRDPKLRDAIGRALMHSMSPHSKDSLIIYESDHQN